MAQGDRDADGFGDACDCTVSRAALPEVDDVRVVIQAPGITYVRIASWRDDRATLGPGIVFDVRTGPLERLRSDRNFGLATCLVAMGEEPSCVDAFASGSRWYLVAQRSACDPPAWGHSTAAPDVRAEMDGFLPCR